MSDTVDKAEAWDAVAKAHDVYAAAREEYRKKIAEQATEIERLRAVEADYDDHEREMIDIEEENTSLRADNERLQAALHEGRESSLQLLGQVGQLSDEITRLRAALTEIRDAGPMTVDDQRWRIARAALEGKQ